MPRIKVNPALLPVKTHFFLFSAAGAAIMPFIPLIGRQMGVAAASIGIIYTVAQILTFVMKPVLGLVADRLKRRKVMLMVVIALALLAGSSISFLPPGTPAHPVSFECGIGTNYIKQCGSQCRRSEEENILELIRKDKPLLSKKHYSHPDIPPNNTLTDTSSVQVREYVEERCQIRCAIPEGHARVQFCHNLDLEEEYAPEFCRTGVDDLEFKFEAILKISSAVLESSCLYLPLTGVRFQPGTQDFQHFACLPNKTELSTCFADCPNNTYLNKHLERIAEEETEQESLAFWLFGFLVCVTYIGLAVSNSMTDTLCFQVLGEKAHNYGMQRQWAAIGWGLFSLTCGYLIDLGSKGELMKNFGPCFYLWAGLLVLDLVVMCQWRITEMEKPKSIRKDMWNLVKEPRVIVFLLTCVSVGMCTSMHWNFLFWHVETLGRDDCSTMEWTKLLQGLMSAVQCFSEIPFFYFAGWFTRKLGYVNCFSLVLFAFGVRFVLYSVLSNPWAFVPMELFQGVTFGIFYSNMAAYASFISPPGASATVQGLVGAAFEGFGMAAGSLLAGYLFEILGGRRSFFIFGVGSLAVCVLHALTMFFLDKRPAYSVPISTTDEPEGEEMFKVNNGTSNKEGSQEVYLSE